MGKKAEKTFVIRGFDAESESFDSPTGVVEDKSTFTERVFKTQSEAIVAMLTDPIICSMTVPDVDCKNTLQIVNLNILLDTTDKLEVRATKTTLREILKRWAEKSRVKNRRGFRASAVRSPEFVYNSNDTHVKAQVILSNTIIYSDSKLDSTPQDQNTVLADLDKLDRELSKRVDTYGGLNYSHSLIGKGVL